METDNEKDGRYFFLVFCFSPDEVSFKRKREKVWEIATNTIFIPLIFMLHNYFYIYF